MSLILESSQTTVGEFNWKQRLAAEMNDVSRWSATVGPAIYKVRDGEDYIAYLEVSVTWSLTPGSYRWLQRHCMCYPIRLFRKFAGAQDKHGPPRVPLCPTSCEWSDNNYTIHIMTKVPTMALSFDQPLLSDNIVLPQLLGILLTVEIQPNDIAFPPVMPASSEWRASHTYEYEDPDTGRVCHSIPAGGGALLYKYPVRMKFTPTDIAAAFDFPTTATITIIPDDHCGYWRRRQDFRQWHNHVYDS